ncbi:MAG: hypothetical protein ACYCYI_00005 [Saccharofermentanales bacterium]
MQTITKEKTVTGQTSQEKMDDILQMLQTGIKEVFTSGKYENYLRIIAFAATRCPAIADLKCP